MNYVRPVTNTLTIALSEAQKHALATALSEAHQVGFHTETWRIPAPRLSAPMASSVEQPEALII